MDALSYPDAEVCPDARLVWVLASLLLIGLTAAWAVHWTRHPARVRGYAADPVIAQLFAFGARPGNEDQPGHEDQPRSSAPTRSRASATAAARTSATSAAVSVRSGARKRNA